MNKKLTERYWEIDFLRGFAVIGMIIFHILYDLNYFNIYKVNIYSGMLLPNTYLLASIFIILVGISLTLSYSKAKEKIEERELKIKFLTRGLRIFGLGLFITIVTWFYLGEGFVVFGVLHCIGLSIILAYPFLRYRLQNFIFGVIVIIAGIILRTLTFDFYWLVWLGFRPSRFYTIDYFPLLPWFGVVLLGVFLGNILYPNYKRVFSLKDFSQYSLVRFFCYLGRNSLIIYFLHQPILVGIIYVFS